MSPNLSVENLPSSATVEALRDFLSPYGTVGAVNRMTDRTTGQWRGFGCVTMASGAPEASAALTQPERSGRRLSVHLANAREARPSRAPRW